MTTSRRPRVLRVGTRASTLARRQAGLIGGRVATLSPGWSCDEVVLTSRGDHDTETPLPELSTRGIFTDVLERALLAGEIDLAVHSLKDVPVDPTPGLVLAAICQREDPRDVLLSTGGWTLDTLPANAVVGTCSTRRSAQLLARRPDLRLSPLRGNIETRLHRLAAWPLAAIVLAAAGLLRLGRTELVTQHFDPEQMVPAPGQGALAVQCRADDEPTRRLLDSLDDPVARGETEAERAFLAGLGGGCTAPIAALGRVQQGNLHLIGLVASPDGRHQVRVTGAAPLADAASLGRALADEAWRRGAGAMLA